MMMNGGGGEFINYQLLILDYWFTQVSVSDKKLQDSDIQLI